MLRLLSKRETRLFKEEDCLEEILKKIKMAQNLHLHPHKLTLTQLDEKSDMFKYYFIF
jgi:hypothetical protein